MCWKLLRLWIEIDVGDLPLKTVFMTSWQILNLWRAVQRMGLCSAKPFRDCLDSDYVGGGLHDPFSFKTSVNGS